MCLAIRRNLTNVFLLRDVKASEPQAADDGLYFYSCSCRGSKGSHGSWTMSRPESCVKGVPIWYLIGHIIF